MPSNPLDDDLPLDDLDALCAEVDRLLGLDPGESGRKRVILDRQARLTAHGDDAVRALLDLEAATTERLVCAIDIGLRVGCRYGLAQAAGQGLDEGEAELLREVALSGLDLASRQRVRVLVEALRMEVGRR